MLWKQQRGRIWCADWTPGLSPLKCNGTQPIGRSKETMSEVIQVGPRGNVAATLAMLAVPSDAVMYLERVPARWLEPSEVADGICLTAFAAGTDWSLWERGRAFCPGWELR